MKQIFMVLLVSLMLMVSHVVEAKDLTSRLGVGVANNFSFDNPGLAAFYHPNNTIELTSALGLDTDEDNSKFGLKVGVRSLIFEEKNMNFFMGGALGMISIEAAGQTESGYEIDALAGGEFFLSGLDNLAFNFEMGVGVVSLKSGTKFRTIAADPFRAGVIFYF